MIAATLGIGERYNSLANFAASTCEWSTGLRTEIIDEGKLAEYGGIDRGVPHRIKFDLFDLFPTESQILFFDADMVFLRKFEVTQLVDEERFVCVPDTPGADWIIHESGMIGIPPEQYFNSGFFIANRANHKEMFEMAAHLERIVHSGFFEQTFFNWARRLCGVEMLLLPQKYNHLEFFKKDHTETVVGHFISANLRSYTTEECIKLMSRFFDDRRER